LKTITIIGGSGFVGKSFIDSFNRNKKLKSKIKKLFIICRNPNKLKKNKEFNFKKVKLIKGDISKLKVLPITDLYIYAAETTQISDYINKKNIINSHRKAIDNFCTLAEKQHLNNILYLSSGAAIRNKHDNNSKYKKIYSKLKTYSENKIKDLSKHNLKTSIARCYTFIGKWLPKKGHYAVENFISDGLHKKEIYVRSSSKVIRSYMYADDLILWLIKIVIHSNKDCPIYNVGSNEQIELRKLAIKIAKIFNKPVKFTKLKNKKTDTYIPNIDKAKRKLNLKINYNLNESIKLTIKERLNEKIN
jgi:nucleoside-diphosphate-sugar epimerase